MARRRRCGASPPLLPLLILLSLSVSPRAVESNDAERSRHLFCGKDWNDAATSCHKHCPSGTSAECPDGMQCFADTPCDSLQAVQESQKKVVDDDGGKIAAREEEEKKKAERSRHMFCGTNWSDAASSCRHHCPSGQSSECPDGMNCFGDTPCDSLREEKKKAEAAPPPPREEQKKDPPPPPREEQKKDPPPPPRASEEERSDRGGEPPPPRQEPPKVEEKQPAEAKSGASDPAGGNGAGQRVRGGVSEERGGGDDGSTTAAKDGNGKDSPPATAAKTTEEEDGGGTTTGERDGSGGTSLSPLGIVAQFASSLLGNKVANGAGGGGPSTSSSPDDRGVSDASAYLHLATDAARDLGSRVAATARAASSDPRVVSTGSKLRDVAVDVGKRTAGGVEIAAHRAAEAMKTTEAGRKFVETTAKVAERASSSRVGSAAVELLEGDGSEDGSIVAFATAGAFVMLVVFATALRVCCRCRRFGASSRSGKRSDRRRGRDLSRGKDNDRLSYGRDFDDDRLVDVDEEKADLAMLEEGYQVSKLERKNDAGERKEPFRLYTEFDYKLRKRSNAPQAKAFDGGDDDGGTGWAAQPYLHGNGHDWGKDGGTMDHMNVRGGHDEDRCKWTGPEKRSFFARIITFCKRLLLSCVVIFVLGCAYVVMTSEEMNLGTLFFVASTHLRHWTMGETALERTITSYQ